MHKCTTLARYWYLNSSTAISSQHGGLPVMNDLIQVPKECWKLLDVRWWNLCFLLSGGGEKIWITSVYRLYWSIMRYVSRSECFFLTRNWKVVGLKMNSWSIFCLQKWDSRMAPLWTQISMGECKRQKHEECINLIFWYGLKKNFVFWTTTLNFINYSICNLEHFFILTCLKLNPTSEPCVC